MNVAPSLDIILFLKDVPLFESLTNHQLAEVARLAEPGGEHGGLGALEVGFRFTHGVEYFYSINWVALGCPWFWAGHMMIPSHFAGFVCFVHFDYELE